VLKERERRGELWARGEEIRPVSGNWGKRETDRAPVQIIPLSRNTKKKPTETQREASKRKSLPELVQTPDKKPPQQKEHQRERKMPEMLITDEPESEDHEKDALHRSREGLPQGNEGRKKGKKRQPRNLNRAGPS